MRVEFLFDYGDLWIQLIYASWPGSLVDRF